MKGSSRFQFILRVDGVDAVDALKAIDTVEATERADWRINFKMKLDEHMLLWNQAAVKLLDIRHKIMNPGERLEHCCHTVYEAPPDCGWMACSRKPITFTCCLAH